MYCFVTYIKPMAIVHLEDFPTELFLSQCRVNVVLVVGSTELIASLLGNSLRALESSRNAIIPTSNHRALKT